MAPRSPLELLADLDASLDAGRDWLVLDPDEGSPEGLGALSSAAAQFPRLDGRGEIVCFVEGETPPRRSPSG